MHNWSVTVYSLNVYITILIIKMEVTHNVVLRNVSAGPISMFFFDNSHIICCYIYLNINLCNNRAHLTKLWCDIHVEPNFINITHI